MSSPDYFHRGYPYRKPDLESSTVVSDSEQDPLRCSDNESTDSDPDINNPRLPELPHFDFKSHTCKDSCKELLHFLLYFAVCYCILLIIVALLMATKTGYDERYPYSDSDKDTDLWEQEHKLQYGEQLLRVFRMEGFNDSNPYRVDPKGFTDTLYTFTLILLINLYMWLICIVQLYLCCRCDHCCCSSISSSSSRWCRRR